ncbi:MAG: pilus assembly protein TadG-related protein [Chloroflexi bacterium]|nr:pilus assembly protein TadG-related protein [Chloroflexota bacterium]
MRRRIGALLNREDGASMIVVMIVAVGLFMMVPVFLDYASLHYTRRVTQTGADAAALAAAIEYADHFSIDWPYGDDWRGVVAGQLCCFGQLCNWNWTWSKMCSVGTYVGSYVLVDGNHDSIGDGAADDYAERNGTEVIDYSASTFSWYEAPRVHTVEWVPVPPVSVDVEVQRRAPMIYGSLYGRNDFYVPARARAEAYMDRYTQGSDLCFIWCCIGYWCIWPSVVPSYDFKWKVRLVE